MYMAIVAVTLYLHVCLCILSSLGFLFWHHMVVHVHITAWHQEMPAIQPASSSVLYTCTLSPCSEVICGICEVFVFTTWCGMLSERKTLTGSFRESFGCQREKGGVNENPTVQEFCSNAQAQMLGD